MLGAANQWFSTGLASTHHHLLMTSRDPNQGKMFHFSDLFNEKMVQFEPELEQNITVSKHNKTSLMINQIDQQVAILEREIFPFTPN